MALASTSRVQVRYIKETVFGETPVTGNARDIRITGESFNYSITKEVSEEINASRASSSMIATSAETSGSINAELSFGEYDEFLSATLQNPWAPYGVLGLGATFEVTAAPDSLTATAATSGVSAFTTLKRGQWFTLTGVPSNNPNYRKLFRIDNLVSPTTTVVNLDASTQAAVSAATPAAVVTTSRLTHGVVQPSYTFERISGDTNEFMSYRGMTASSFSLSASSGSRTTIDFEFMGRDAVRGANVSTLPNPGTVTPSQAYDIMSGVSGSSCVMWVGGVPLTGTFINSVSLKYDNALRMQKAMCSLGAVGIGSGTIAVTADIEVYFATGAKFYDEFLNNSNLEMSFTTFDNSGNGYVWTMPKANVSSYTVNAGGKDADLMASIQLTGLMDSANADPALRKVLFIDRVGAALVP